MLISAIQGSVGPSKCTCYPKAGQDCLYLGNTCLNYQMVNVTKSLQGYLVKKTKRLTMIIVLYLVLLHTLWGLYQCPKQSPCMMKSIVHWLIVCKSLLTCPFTRGRDIIHLSMPHDNNARRVR